MFYGCEAWPGAFPKDEGACLFMDNTSSNVLYQKSYWRDNITPSLAHWRASLATCGLTPLSACVATGHIERRAVGVG